MHKQVENVSVIFSTPHALSKKLIFFFFDDVNISFGDISKTAFNKKKIQLYYFGSKKANY